MAALIPTEGLNYWLNIMFKQGTPPANLYLGLFTGATATTTPPATATLGNSTGVTEVAYTGYARQAITPANWGTVGALTADSVSGQGYTAAQVSFPAAGAAYSGPAINGFLIATQLAVGAGSISVLYSNFDDGTGIASLALGDIVKVTPKYVLGG